MELVENLVIGGGPAGAMVALRLARAGRPVVLVEKERASHHKVCGEFLSGEAAGYLEQSGIDLAGLGAAEIRRVRMSAGRRSVEAELPFRAASLSRKVLDEALLARASEAGAQVRRGVEVEALCREAGRWHAGVRGAASLRARTVFLASGKHEVRGWARAGGSQTDLVGFKLHWRLARAQTEALGGAMELFLFRDGYGGMSLVEDGIATLCFVVRRKRLRTAGGISKLLEDLRRSNARLAERLGGAVVLWARPLAIAQIPYGYVAREEGGLWRIGDQAAVIPSFTGDGMSIALHSAALAAQIHLAGGTIAEYQHVLGRQLRGSMRVATLLSRLMVTGLGRAAAPAALEVLPGAMGWIAASTRIPEEALLWRQPEAVLEEAGRA